MSKPSTIIILVAVQFCHRSKSCHTIKLSNNDFDFVTYNRTNSIVKNTKTTLTTHYAYLQINAAPECDLKVLSHAIVNAFYQSIFFLFLSFQPDMTFSFFFSFRNIFLYGRVPLNYTS